MKVMLTGGSGQLGRALSKSVAPDVELIAPEGAVLDLANPASIQHAFASIRPDVVINAGAYTAVDRAESEPELAFAINSHAAGVIARTCAEFGARLIHVSTDFVFDGTKSSPYLPSDAPNPLSVYGRSKLEGERQVATTDRLHSHIVRTAWVYAPVGRNFVLTMLRLFGERETISVVCDQIGTPTSAATLARCIWQIASRQNAPAVCHYTDAGTASWYDFAVAIYEEAVNLGFVKRRVKIVPIRTEQYPTPARRPLYSVLDKSATLAALELDTIHWREALRTTLREIAA